MFRLATKLAFRPAGIYRHLPRVHTCMAICTPPMKTITNLLHHKAYSEVTMLEGEKLLGFRVREFARCAISVNQMLAEARPEIQGLEKEQLQQTKNKVFDNIVEYIEVEGYPTDFDPDFNEANINDLVLLTILPILTAFRRETGRELCFQRENKIVAVDSEVGDFQEFVGMDFIGDEDRKFFIIAEARPSSTLGQAKWQCMLALKDMGNKNHGGIVYGFVTTGERWQMIRYDGSAFTQSRRFCALFPAMETNKQEWMKDFSIIVDCIHMALRSGSFVAK